MPTYDPDAQCLDHGCARWRCDEGHAVPVTLVTRSPAEELRLALTRYERLSSPPRWMTVPYVSNVHGLELAISHAIDTGNEERAKELQSWLDEEWRRQELLAQWEGERGICLYLGRCERGGQLEGPHARRLARAPVPHVAGAEQRGRGRAARPGLRGLPLRQRPDPRCRAPRRNRQAPRVPRRACDRVACSTSVGRSTDRANPHHLR